MAEKYKRRCENWLGSFRDWVLPTSEAPESYILWAGIFALSSATRRNVAIGKKYLGGWTCNPYQYILFVAPPGMRKTTTVEKALDILQQIPTLVEGPTLTSSAALLDSIVHADKNSVYLLIGELGEIIAKTGLELFEFLTYIYDGKRKITAKTISRGVEFAERPCLNLIAATTPQWISGNLPEALIGGGFASRVIFVYEDTLRSKRMYYHGEKFDLKARDELEKNLVYDLTHIATLEGEFELTKEAQEFGEHWYQEVHKTEGLNRKLQGYYQRKPTHLHKVAQLIHLSYSDELIIEKHDFEGALDVLQKTEKNLLKVFAGVGKNTFSLTMSDVKAYVDEKGQVKVEDLLKDFQTAAEPRKLVELIEGLLVMREISQVNVDGDNYYQTKKKSEQS